MKFESLLGLFLLTSMSIGSVAAEPIWPAGKTPYLKENAPDAENPTLHLYPTKGTETHTKAAVVICPGGGYGGLARDHEGHQPAQWFNEQGVSAFVLHYRLGSQGYHYPTQLADVQRAIRWVRAHAEKFDLDPERIAVMGFSAGGHLASMAATLYDEKVYESSDDIDKVSARPNFAVLCYPVISMEQGVTHGGSRKNLLGPERANDPKWIEKLSSEKNVTAETPPTFLFQTNEDTAVPAENAVGFYLALRKHGVPTEMHIYEKGPHGVGLYRGDPVLGTWSGHLRDWLRTHFFYSGKRERASVKGSATLDGEPVSWGVLTFHPGGNEIPPTSVRIRRGKFSVPAKDGPVLGDSTLTLEGSIWEKTGSEKDRAVSLKTLSPDAEAPIKVAVGENNEPLALEFRSR